MPLQVYVNGDFVDAEKATVSVWDHGFLYGDGVFEGIRAYHGRVFRLEDHVRRLFESAHSIRLDMRMTRDEMTRLILEVCRRNQITDGYIRVAVSRGKGDLGLDPRKCDRPTVVIIADRIKLYPEAQYKDGIQLIFSSVRRVPVESLDSKIKSLNYLNNILAKIEANTSGADEAIMVNTNGYVTECTAENIFLYRERQNVLRTPAPYVGILEGVTRGVVLELARKSHVAVEETIINPNDLFVADEVFLTGTGAELIPVVQIAGRNIGTGKPGPIFKMLLERFREVTLREGAAIYPEPGPAGAERPEAEKPKTMRAAAKA